MNPIGLLNNDMSTFLMASQQVFQTWNDTVAGAKKANTSYLINHYTIYYQTIILKTIVGHL